MDANANVLADEVRAKRRAVDEDLAELRVRINRVDPRRLGARAWVRTAVPLVAVTAAVGVWARRRKSVRSLEDLLGYGLTELYNVETLLVPALEKMRAQASNLDLRRAFETHRHETEGHIERLTRVFRSIGIRPRRRPGASGIDGIISENERLLKATADADVRDASLIAAAQRIEHVEIAAYGTVRAHAETLGFTYPAQLLQQTLEEERKADEKLSALAERFVNPQSIRSARPD